MGQNTGTMAVPWTGSVEERVHELSYSPTRAWKALKGKLVVNKVTPMDPSSPMRPGWARFVCMSDTHCQISDRLQVPKGDVLIHAGDFTNIGQPEDVEKFAAFLDSQPHPHKIVIAGNHELSFDEENFLELVGRYPENSDLTATDPKALKAMLGKHCTYLEDQQTEVMGFRIYGSPWQPEFGGWAFNLKRGRDCLAMWDKIPEDTEVLITHGPPLGHGDKCYDGQRAGCVDLLQTVQRRVRPKYHIFGHIHEGYGVSSDGYTTYINASTCTLRYQPNNPPIVFELPLPETAGSRGQGAT